MDIKATPNPKLITIMNETKVALREAPVGARLWYSNPEIKDELNKKLYDFYTQAVKNSTTTRLIYDGGKIKRVVNLVAFDGPEETCLYYGQQVLSFDKDGRFVTEIGNPEDFVDRYVVAEVPLGIPTSVELQSLFESIWRELGGFSTLRILEKGVFPPEFKPDFTTIAGCETEGNEMELRFTITPRLQVQPDGKIKISASLKRHDEIKKISFGSFDPSTEERSFDWKRGPKFETTTMPTVILK